MGRARNYHQDERFGPLSRVLGPEREHEADFIFDPHGAPLRASNVPLLQKLVGNHAVSMLALRPRSERPIQRQDVEGPAESVEEAPTGGVLDPIEGEPIGKENCETPKADRQEVPPARAGLPVVVNLGFGAEEHSGDDRGRTAGKHDAVGASLSLGSTVTRSGSASPFGEEFATYRVDNISWTKSGPKVAINARLFVSCRWNTNSGGNTDVPSANAPVVTAANKVAIADDLKPDASGRPARATYWAEDLTARHEQFHAQDDIARAQLYVPAAKAFLESQTVAPNDAAVATLLETARANLQADGWAWYNGSPGGENRAYADGKAGYQARADAVRARVFPAAP